MDDLKNYNEFINNHQNVSNRPNFKNFIAFRKDVKNNKINNSYCIVETENKKISFDLVDNVDFFEKSNLKLNIKAIKEKIDSRIKSAKNRSNNELWKNINLITEEKENIINSSNKKNNNVLYKKEITETIKKYNFGSCEKEKKSYQDFENKEMVFENPSSDEIRVKENLASNKRRSSILNKNSIYKLQITSNERDDYAIVDNKNKKEIKDFNIIDEKNVRVDEDIFRKMNDEIDSSNIEEKSRALPSTKNFNNHLLVKNRIKPMNNSDYNDLKKNKDNIHHLSQEEKYIYESINSSNSKIKHEKNISESGNLIEDINFHDKSKVAPSALKKISIDPQENKSQDFSLNKIEMNDELSGTNINNCTLRNEKRLSSEENIIFSSEENMNPNKEVFSFNNEKLIKKTITIINAPVPKIDCEKVEIDNRIKTENFNANTNFHLNLNKRPCNNQFEKVFVKNSHISKGQKSEEKLGTQCNVTIEENSIIYPFQFCYICDNLNQIDFVYNSEICNHSICYKCLKSFLENKIDLNVLWTKCPIFTCNGEYKLELIKNIISDYHYRQLQLASSRSVTNRNDLNLIKNKTKESGVGKQDKGEENLSKNKAYERIECGFPENNNNQILNSPHTHLNMRTCMHNENDSPTNLHSNIKSYSKKNFVELNNLDNFYSYNKNRENYCKKCNEPSLFIRPGKSSAKCLNCFATFCKYCLKPMSFDHFDLNSFNYCKVYFRRKLKTLTMKNNSLNKLKSGIITFLMIIASYLILLINCFYLLSKTLKKLLNIDGYGTKINYFYFINKNNYKKYGYIKTYFETKNNNKEDPKKEDIISENKMRDKELGPKLNNNLIININKKEDHLSKQKSLKENSEKNNDNYLINLKFNLPMENENANFNSYFSEFKLLDKNLMSFLKSKLEKGRSINNLRIRKTVSSPDNRGAFYFYDIYENENHLIFNQQGLSSECDINSFKRLKISNFSEDFFLYKILRYFFYFLLFLILGPILLFIMFFLIPFFPLLILIFQI